MAETFTLKELNAPGKTFTLAELQKERPAVVKVGDAINDIPRQLGLTARYGIEGLANTAQVFTEPVRQLITDPIARLASKNAKQGRPLGEEAAALADWLGLPKPINATERVVGDASRLVAGAGGMAGGFGKLAQAATGSTKAVLAQLASNPTQQLSAAAGGGLFGGSSREAGGGAGAQVGATVLGAVLGGMAPGALSGAANAIKAPFIKPDTTKLEGRISLALKEAGTEWRDVPEAIRKQLVSDVQKATKPGANLNADAIRRLADFRMTGTAPTRGMLTLDPVQITREQNLAKIGANTADGELQGLARLQNQNNQKLIANVNDLGANRGDPLQAGEYLAGTVLGKQASLRAAEQQAWDAAKSLPGYRQPISGAVLSDVNQALDADGLMPFMNPTISRYMEAFQQGQQPFTPQAYRNLQSMLSREMAKGGNEGAAAGLAARILRDADLTPAGFAAQPGGVVTGQMAAAMRGVDGAADDAVSAVNAARSATRQAYAFEESSPIVRAVLSEGAAGDPQRIASRFIIGGTPNETREVVNLLGGRNLAPVKNAVLAHLKESAIGKGTADEVGKFSQSAFNRALAQIGERKLSMLFTPEEIAQLRANGRVASYMQAQPVGSAVNNSNSGALLMGAGYDWLKSAVSKIPAGQSLIIDPLRNIEVSLLQSQAQNLAPALATTAPRAPMAPSFIGPGLAAAGLLAAPSVNRP